MSTIQNLVKHFNEAYFGGNWTAANFKDTLSSVTLEQAKTKVSNLNTILALAYHIHYYVKGTIDVFKGGPLEIRDKYSFDHPKLTSETEWEAFKDKLWNEAKEFSELVAKFDDSILNTTFVEEKYGTYYRNIAGIIEHTYYHTGQIALVKKML